MASAPDAGTLTCMGMKVAVINSNEDLIEVLRIVLTQAGLETVVAHVPDIKRGREDLLSFVAQHEPAVIVYDIAPPYEENWNFLRLLQNLQIMQGRRWVLTTTNKRALDALVGDTGSFEILGKPYDTDRVLTSVLKAISER
jgi:DNA-binding NtrC family response regulator